MKKRGAKYNIPMNLIIEDFLNEMKIYKLKIEKQFQSAISKEKNGISSQLKDLSNFYQYYFFTLSLCSKSFQFFNTRILIIIMKTKHGFT